MSISYNQYSTNKYGTYNNGGNPVNPNDPINQQYANPALQTSEGDAETTDVANQTANSQAALGNEAQQAQANYQAGQAMTNNQYAKQAQQDQQAAAIAQNFNANNQTLGAGFNNGSGAFQNQQGSITGDGSTFQKQNVASNYWLPGGAKAATVNGQVGMINNGQNLVNATGSAIMGDKQGALNSLKQFGWNTVGILSQKYNA